MKKGAKKQRQAADIEINIKNLALEGGEFSRNNKKASLEFEKKIIEVFKKKGISEKAGGRAARALYEWIGKER